MTIAAFAATKPRRRRLSGITPDPPPTPVEGEGIGQPYILVAGNLSDQPDIWNAADYRATSSASSGTAALEALNAAATEAGPDGTVYAVGEFFVSDTFNCACNLIGAGPGGTIFRPTSAFLGGRAIVAIGNSLTYRPFRRAENFQIEGRYVANNGGTYPNYSVTRTVHGLQFASAGGRLVNLLLQNCTGYGLDLSAPASGGTCVNVNRGTTLFSLTVGRNITGGVRFGANGAGDGVTWAVGVAMHSGKVGSTKRIDGGHGLVVNANDVTIISNQPYSPTGSNLKAAAGVQWLRTLNFKPEGDPQEYAAIDGRLGGSHWLIHTMATRTGGGICLNLPGVTDSLVTAGVFSGERINGDPSISPVQHALDLTGASGVMVGSSVIKDNKYRRLVVNRSTVANPTVISFVLPAGTTDHGWQTGDRVFLTDHVGSTPNINRTIYTVTRINATTLSLPVQVTVAGSGGHLNSEVVTPEAGNPLQTIGNLTLDNDNNHTITTVAGSAVIDHGIELAPNAHDILLTPRGNLGANGRVWITNVGAETFTLNWAGLPTSPSVVVGWSARWTAG